LSTGEQMIARIPRASIAVAESAIRSVDDVGRMAAAGFDAVLVGEALVRAVDPAALVQAFASVPTVTRSS
jgi:indole-3-glycerol phosphate synthase